MDEKAFKNKVMAELRRRNLFAFCTHEPYRAGVPDIYCCSGGRSVWLELKYTDDTKSNLQHPLSAQQSVFLRDINKAGGLGVVAIGVPDGLVHFEQIWDAGKRNKFALETNIPLSQFVDWIVEETKDW